MSNMVRIVLFALLMLLWLHPASAADDEAQAKIRAALTEWAADFNARRADKVCDLFETGIVADVRDAPEQDYRIICDRLKRVLTDRARSYTYSPDIKEILVFGEVARYGLPGLSRLRAVPRENSNPSSRESMSSAGRPTEAGRSCVS